MTEKEMSQAAKRYLMQIQKTDRLIDRLISTVSSLRSRLTSQSYALKPDKIQASGSRDVLGETYARIDELERKINEHIDDLIRMKGDAYDRIIKVEDTDQQNILIARYIEKKKWEQISVEINFSIAQVYRIHGTALLNFAEKNSDVLKVDSF